MKTIARTSRFFVGFVAVAVTPIILRALMSPTRWSVLWAIGAIAVVVRVAQIRLSVGPDTVRISNFFKTVEVPVWEAEVELGEPEPGIALNDAGGPYPDGGKLIYIRRQWHGDRVHVGVAPRFGHEADRIHDELVEEIRRARAA